ncbi:unnamed protein product [Fusarium graminearum]|uniref:Uncharacterized protein n=1 Tax=Gibberella zeae TaxID=5518 RepID=A0A4E9ELD2_GIBZA|nr:unnamed protein product [Fusarium graminearum]
MTSGTRTDGRKNMKAVCDTVPMYGHINVGKAERDYHRTGTTMIQNGPQPDYKFSTQSTLGAVSFRLG